MKAVILAAGKGTRLRPITDFKPKCLVNVAGKPIIEHQVSSLYKAGVKEILIVTGYRSEDVELYVEELKQNYKGVNIEILNNRNYVETNNMYSLFLASSFWRGESFCLLNGDVAIGEEVANTLIQNAKENLIAVDVGNFDDEAMKVTLATDQKINDISKDIPESFSFGTSIDFYKFSSQASELLFQEVSKIVDKEKRVNEWTEIALKQLLSSGRLLMDAHDINKGRWTEIDNIKDLIQADLVFTSFTQEKFNQKEAIFFDIDGTLTIDNTLIPGVQKLLYELNKRHFNYFFLSNNSSKSKLDYVEKFRNLDVEISCDDIILSTDGLVRYLKEEKYSNVFMFGTKSFREELESFNIKHESQNPELIVLAYDTELTYEKLQKTCELINAGVSYIATHSDLVCPTSKGDIPDIGLILEMIHKTTNVAPKKIFGKPNKQMIEFVLKDRNIDVTKAVMIGDRIYTDYALSQAINCDFVAVLSGEMTRADIELNDCDPILIVDTVKCIIDLL